MTEYEKQKREMYLEAEERADELYKKYIFPEVSKTVTKVITDYIVPIMDAKYKEMLLKASNTGIVTPMENIGVIWDITQSIQGFWINASESMGFLPCKSYGPILKKTENYTLEYEILLRVIRECLEEYGLLLKTDENAKFFCSCNLSF